MARRKAKPKGRKFSDIIRDSETMLEYAKTLEDGETRDGIIAANENIIRYAEECRAKWGD